MSTLTAIRDRIEQRLNDTGNTIWSTNWLDEGLRQALAEWSLKLPYQAITTLTLASDTHELDISAVSGLLSVERLWIPYTSSDPENPPNWEAFEHWEDAQIVYMPDREGQSGDVARIYYTTAHTINGLDSETATTLTVPVQSILITGAAAHAALNRALDIQEQVTLGRKTAAEIERWGAQQLTRFEADLDRMVRARSLRRRNHAHLPPLDRWDRDGGGWS